ncbi:metal ABC transporter substrate-binding protein [Candidatus Uabimicrobium sp. HlEnr_7]|uniref:metal ABC transporter substrate-binding protein n=1 Tax=Candidatus Uabimicrobium helgolandensis TaxID=3095367 RepID=UPI0035561E70
MKYFIILILIAVCGCDSKTSTSSLLKVCVTTTDLQDLVKTVGGKHVDIYCFTHTCCHGDPHDVHITPEFVRKLNGADILIDAGMGIAASWLPELVKSAKRPEMAKEKYIDISKGIWPLQNTQENDEGSLHEEGNPHYLLDPVEGIKAAKLICETLSKLQPQYREDFTANYQKFRNTLGNLLVGEKLHSKFGAEKIAVMYSKGELQKFLQKNNAVNDLGGWIKALQPHRNAKLVGDHDLWPHMTRIFGFEIIGYLEPKPGVPPTTSHLSKLVAQMKEQNVKIVLASTYFDKRHVKFVSQNSGAKVLRMAHQVASLDNVKTYIETITYNVEQILQNIQSTR